MAYTQHRPSEDAADNLSLPLNRDVPEEENDWDEEESPSGDPADEDDDDEDDGYSKIKSLLEKKQGKQMEELQ